MIEKLAFISNFFKELTFEWGVPLNEKLTKLLQERAFEAP